MVSVMGDYGFVLKHVIKYSDDGQCGISKDTFVLSWRRKGYEEKVEYFVYLWCGRDAVRGILLWADIKSDFAVLMRSSAS